ncbi:mandelate racemase, partial [Halobacteriales archaeon QH_3_68_24]
MAPEITRIESVEFAYEIPDMGTDHHGFNLVYTPGESVERKLFALK